MSLIRLNARGDGDATQTRGTWDDPETRLRHALSLAPHSSAPIVIMVHGYKYDPTSPENSPHNLIFGQKHPNSWPQGLGISPSSATLAVSYGWRARGNPRRVFASAGRRGKELGALIEVMQALAPTRPVHIIGHSMGAEVALQALAVAPAHSISRIILLAGATYQSRAAASLQSPAGRTAEIINIISHQNALFDTIFEWLIPSPCRGDRVIGYGMTGNNVINIRLDSPVTRAALRTLHFEVERPRYPVCHWSGYTTPGALSFYGQLMAIPGVLSLRRLRQTIAHEARPARHFWQRATGNGWRRWLSAAYDTAH